MLTWNLFHGRSVPGAGRALAGEFADHLAAWDWQLALLQEVPPWWPAMLAAMTGARHCSALTSRNGGLALRRAVAQRWPDAIKSNGGGCNAILARVPIAEHRTLRLRTWPERRVAQIARLADGTVVANYHGSARVALAEAELSSLWACALRWAQDSPLVLGGDLNLRSPRPGGQGVLHVARRDVDHLFAAGLRARGEAELLARFALIDGRSVQLSDHPPLAVTLVPA